MAGPASSIPPAYHFNSFYHSHLLPLLKARLVIVAGLAWSSSSTPLITLFPTPLFLSLSSLAALRAPAAMGDRKWSCWRSSRYDPQVILLDFCTSRSTCCSGLSGCASPSGTMPLWWTTSPGCASLLRLWWWSWVATTSLPSAFSCTRPFERILRGLWDLLSGPASFHCGVFHQDQSG